MRACLFLSEILFDQLNAGVNELLNAVLFGERNADVAAVDRDEYFAGVTVADGFRHFGGKFPQQGIRHENGEDTHNNVCFRHIVYNGIFAGRTVMCTSLSSLRSLDTIALPMPPPCPSTTAIMGFDCFIFLSPVRFSYIVRQIAVLRKKESRIGHGVIY